MSHRGEYRSIHTVLVDSPEFLDLSPEAQLIFFHLKLRLGPSGIGVLYPQMLEAVMPSESLSKGLEELRAGEDRAWLYVERNVFWLRNALRYDPSISLNHEKQRRGILNHLGSLPKLSICNRFARYYEIPLPFPDLEPSGDTAETSSNASPEPCRTPPHTPSGSRSEGSRIKEEERRTKDEGEEKRGSVPVDDRKPAVALGLEIERSADHTRSDALEFRKDSQAAMKSSEIVARWIAFTGLSLSPADRGKQGAAAKRLAKTRSRVQIVQAMVGMTQLYPHSNGEPWDIFDLERKFAKAQAAAARHPEVRARNRQEELSRALLSQAHVAGPRT